jgi:hypothetical protein
MVVISCWQRMCRLFRKNYSSAVDDLPVLNDNMIGSLTSGSQPYFLSHPLAFKFEYRHRPAGAAMFAGVCRF